MEKGVHYSSQTPIFYSILQLVSCFHQYKNVSQVHAPWDQGYQV